MKPNIKPWSRRFTSLAAVAAPLLLTGLLSACGAGGTVTAASAADNAGAGAKTAPLHRTAYDPVTGTMVAVSVPTGTTPVKPTKVTHPGSDSMGTITAEHSGGAASAKSPAAAPNVAGLPGIDVSSYQGNLTWSSIAPHIDFSYAKATEGTGYTNPDFANQYNGPYNNGVIRGAYHFALPNNSGGAAQADYFVAHGGGWSSDGKTLPGALDIEYNPYGAECYGLSQSSMTNWIWSFASEYAAKTGVYPVIYSTYDWWHTCTSSSTTFSKYDPFWIADYNGSAGTLPAGYTFYTFWQYADSGSEPGDQDTFNGAYSQLQKIAKG